MLNYYDFVKANPGEFKQFSCKDLLFLIIDCPPDFTKGEDWSQYNAFIYVIGGNHKLFNRERAWHLQTGSSVFVKKGGLGTERVDEEIFCALMFYVPDEYLCSFIRENADLLPPADLSSAFNDKILPVQTTAVMDAFYQSVLPYFSQTEQPPEDLVELKFRELLLNIITDRNNKELTTFFYRLAMTNADDLNEIMESNYLYSLQLHEYARLCHRSLSSFKRDFHQVYAIPPGRWLLEKRLNVAERFLKNSDLPVMDVAIESGFKNITHFTRVFKQRFGTSPLQYRKQFSVKIASLS
jgi:AraC family transcriptional regulator, exoenzyme S synthesis regulatory protein ExsA